MNGNHRSDDIVRAWVQSGPELASADLVERTLRPVPRMRQRRSWRILLERLSAPVLAGTGAVALVAVLIVGIGRHFVGMRGVGGPADSDPEPSKPTFELTVRGGPGAGTYRRILRQASTSAPTRPTARGAISMRAAIRSSISTSSWALAGRSDGSSDVAVELYAGHGYLRFDPGILRGGDAKDRSTTFTVSPRPGDYLHGHRDHAEHG